MNRYNTLKNRWGDDDKEDIEEQKEEMGDEGIKIEEFIEAKHVLKRRKSVGHDNITAEMLQIMEENGLEMLTELFNKIWEKERIPRLESRNSYTII